ncbi:MAG: hypothetical protein PWR21_606 [Methanoculleus sp.]|nr:hypothetical protein [Methanoculleus sp.]MDK2989164.1 hypothetical protein [Methanoculleus sp.]
MIASRGGYNSNLGAFNRHELIAIVKHEESINDAFTLAFETTRNIDDFRELIGRVCGSGRADFPISTHIYAGATNAR